MSGVDSDLLWSQEGSQSGEGGRVSRGEGGGSEGRGVLGLHGTLTQVLEQSLAQGLLPGSNSCSVFWVCWNLWISLILRIKPKPSLSHPCSPLPWTPSPQPSSMTLWPHQPASCPLDGKLRAFTCCPPQRHMLLPITPQPAPSLGTNGPDTQ